VYLLIGAGLALLVVGGDSLVRGAVSIARRLGVSPMLIGLTLVGFGTSLPELMTSVQAVLVDSPGIAVGNVVGSNIANILLILGIAAVLQPIATHPDAFYRDGAVLAISALVAVAVSLNGEVDRVTGGGLLLVLIGYIVWCYLSERRRHDPSADVHAEQAELFEEWPRSLSLAIAIALAGIGMTVLGAYCLVDGAIALALRFGVSDAVIGLTVVAVGTSLPELVTAIIAAARGHADVAFGNIIGSNTFNVFGILGTTALVKPILVPPEILSVDIWVMLGVTGLLILFAITGWRLIRAEGAIFLAGYAAYIAWLGRGMM
jgi:cation:H+ antiporter